MAIVAVVCAAGYTFWLMRPASAAQKEHPDVLPLEVGDGFAVENVAAIRRPAEGYAPFADADRLWRERAIARMLDAMRSESAAAKWTPSAEQILDDSVFALTQASRYAEAAALLQGWLATHPTDIDRAITAARLLGQTPRLDDSFALYERALQARASDRALRREYAEALLYGGRYERAAGQFTHLVAADDRDRAARLGLARALAWSNRAAEAEPLLARLAGEAPGDTALRALLRSTRANLEPTSQAALRWVESDGSFVGYRLALARAYAREGRHADAATAFDAVLADTVTVPLLTEAAGSRAAGGDSLGTAALLGRAVALAPADAALRERYAQALAWSGNRRGALAEYTQLLWGGDDARLRLVRGQLYLYIGDESSALADLERSAALQPSYDALATIGDLYRWRGDYARSSAAYNRALALRPADGRVLAALALVRAAERLALAQNDVGDEPGWNAGGSYAEDNAGFLLLSSRLAYGFSAGRATTGSVGVEQRRVSHRSVRDLERIVYGYAVGAALQHYFKRAQVGTGAGVARHALVRDMLYGHISASVPAGPLLFRLRASTGPAYPDLWSLWTLVRTLPDAAGMLAPLRARTVTASVAAPVGRATVEVTGERLSLDDGNDRTSVNVAVRQPVSRSFRVLYSAGSLGWSGAASGYWDPRSYTQHAVGVEYGRTVGTNLSVATRAMAGVARSTERVTLAPGGRPAGSTWAPQFSTGVDATYRGRAFEITAGGAYGRGAPREGGVPGYQSLNGTLRVRVDWP